MLDSKPSKLFCRYCHHYSAEGRRGGMCEQLGVPVQGQWTACALVSPILGLGEERVLAVAQAPIADRYELAESQSSLQSVSLKLSKVA